ncbi:MAG: hypothetical protein U1E70_14125 [Acetobacteraceae bacterium]
MWLTPIVAETTSATSGIGFMAMNAREFAMQTDVVVVSILIYAAPTLPTQLLVYRAPGAWSWNPAYVEA